MALSASARLKLPFLFANQSQKEVTVNTGLLSLDALVCAITPQWGRTSPPSSPANGDLYVIPSSGATGTWAGKGDQIVFYSEGWHYLNPIKGLRVLDEDTMSEFVYDGTEWGARAGGEGGSALIVKKSGGSNLTPATLIFNSAQFNVVGSGSNATVTLVGGGGTVAIDDNGTEVSAAATTLNIGDGLKPILESAGYITIESGIRMAAQGDEVLTLDGDPSTPAKGLVTLNFGTGFDVVATAGGYYSVNVTAGDATITIKDDGTAGAGFLKSLNFAGAGVTVSEGAGVNAGNFTISIAGGDGGAGGSIHTYSSLPGSAVPLDAYANHIFNLASNWSPTFSAGSNPGVKISATLYLKQTSGGSHTVTWPAGIKWDGNQEPILSLTNGKYDIVYLESIDDGATWFGAQIGGNI